MFLSMETVFKSDLVTAFRVELGFGTGLNFWQHALLGTRRQKLENSIL